MATITPVSNPALHATLLSKWRAEVTGWEKPSHVMNGGAQYTVVEKSDGTFEFAEDSSETMHDTTSGRLGRK